MGPRMLIEWMWSASGEGGKEGVCEEEEDCADGVDQRF